MISTNRFFLVAISSLVMLLSACSMSPVSDNGGTVNPDAKVVEVPAAASAAYQNVLKAIDEQQWTAALTQLKSLKVQYPQLTSLSVMEAWVLWQSGKVEDAADQFEFILAGPALYKSDAYNYLAILYREQGRFKESETLYLKALSIWPGDSSLHKNLGILYELYFQQLPKALSHYKQAQALVKKDKQLDGWIKDLERRVAQ